MKTYDKFLDVSLIEINNDIFVLGAPLQTNRQIAPGRTLWMRPLDRLHTLMAQDAPIMIRATASGPPALTP